ncbi:ABC transporter ATP-binding protein [Galbibacter pacificus]|uniref:ABC transporter ATP-binding protein n=1 Tax=Galbibacter pacificus TaxID=2996052 RepID=A0ABT6FU55_9FLAO|nr:ABC transporter ATP-binding protein [Galbibacter pacificus]MDG3583148.1 ABC transporter ATP-binding protein [Galbibacter pacificus]MDG3586629.1 ABC transporter ATP-binding protein [Galbibacter pacificus]
MNTLKIKNVSLVYNNGYQALNAVNLEIKNGIFGLLGPNGAGKSSLMKTIVGLQKPSEGSLIFNGSDIVNEPFKIQKHLGFLPQYFGVYPKVSAYNLLDHIAKLKGIQDLGQRHEQIMNILEKVNLLDAKNKEVHTFSGGMKQRFGVAQALLGEPKIVIVDEPTAGLDPEERNRFNTLLSELSEDIIVVLSTHLVEDVRNLCSTMAIIEKGAIISQGAPTYFIEQLNGKLWAKAIEKSELSKLETEYRVISKQLIEKVMHITVNEDVCPIGFHAITPSLEHVYFNYLNRYKK